MKTILVPVSNSFFIRNFLRTDAFTTLIKNENVRLVLLAPEKKLEYYKKEFSHPRLFFDVLPDARNAIQEKTFMALEKASIHTRTVSMLQRWDFRRAGAKAAFLMRLPVFCVRRMCWFFGKYRWWRVFLRRLFFIIPSSYFQHLFQKYSPDLAFAPTLLYGETIFLKEAKKRGISTAGMVLSWDNFYSKTLPRIHPDRLIVHTDLIKEQAARLGDVPRERVFAIGIPQYDCHFRKAGIMRRDEFVRSLGGDPSKKLILYAFSGKAGLSVDFDILDILHDAIKKGEIHESAQVLVRPYPRYDIPEERLKILKEKYGFLAEPSMAHVGGAGETWEFDAQSLSLLENSLAHANLVITMYSTFFIEAAIYDTPLIGIAFDGYKNFDYWNSARRFFDWDHLADIQPLGGIILARSREYLVRSINEFLENPAQYREERRAIVSQQCQFTDGKSGERLAGVIFSEINKL